jgi:cyclopropane fatty-acyl-phospholipid synthase-like methyltransferase
MQPLIATMRAVGLGRLVQLYQAYRLGWQGIISGFYTTRIMQALFNVGFFDEIQRHGKVEVATFAAREKLDASILQSLCNSLYALHILDRNGSGYTLTSKGRTLTKVARGWFDLVYGYEEIFHSLEELLKKEKIYNKDIYRRPDYVARGSGEIEAYLYFPIAVDILKQQSSQKVLDLGCGDGTFLRNLCQNSNMLGYGIDMAPEAIADGSQQVESAGLADRVQLFVLNIAEIEQVPEPLRQIDAATTFFVLHELLHLGEEAVIDFLSGFRRLYPGVPLIIFEVIRPTLDQMRARPGMIVQYTLFHDLTNQVLVSAGEWRRLFQQAGFTSIEEMHLQFVHTSVFTLR